MATASAHAQTNVSFKRDVQPVLRRHCYRCHGHTKAEGGFRFTQRKSAFGSGDSGEKLIKPGDPDRSPLIVRLTDRSAGDIMPLDGEPLDRDEIATLRQWIKDGASWPDELAEDKHWAYVKPRAVAPPKVERSGWAKNAIDLFILRRLEEEGLSPSPAARREKLIRRVYLALIGLPPSPQEVGAFVNDPSPNAYEKVVDRLLASDRYGERWAQHWLDLARYADSNGYQADQLRDSWAYRDWVIKALNSGMPFDRFVVEQLAGDLLPNATVDQKIATGFHRTPTCNVEAGVHPEANRVNQVFDRVNTTGTVFLGTSIECCQCHDHKYDPFTQRDYYGLFAYFNNTPLEVKLNSGVQFNFYGPAMPLPLTGTQRERHAKLQSDIGEVEEQVKQLRSERLTSFNQWLRQVERDLAERPARWTVLPIKQFSSTGREDHTLLEDGSVLLGGSLPGTAIYTIRYRQPLADVVGFKIEALTHDSLPGKGPGRGDAERTNFILSEFSAEIVDEKGETVKQVSLHSAAADFSQKNWEVAKAIDGSRTTGWAIAPQFGKPHWATFRTDGPVRLADGQSLIVKLDQNYGRGRTLGRVRISALTGSELTADLPPNVRAAVKAKQRSEKQRVLLRDHFANSNPRLGTLNRKLARLRKQMTAIKPDETLVMVEMNKPRTTHIFNRGNYLDKGDPVQPHTPRTLHPIDPQLPRNRLGLAKWLVSPENPLLPRVTVNRWWAEMFGRGLVDTPEDFGTQGEDPTHPELLDWLADRFVKGGFSQKQMHKLMVMSAAFRQSAKSPPPTLARDPQNRLLARGPRFRLPAETIRDNALAVSGLLSTEMYGPPIMPYQPGGIWKAVGRNQPKWVTATDEDRFRRGLYVVWKRGAPYPSFVTFDAPDRAACTVQRARTNTPLQALTLLNDPAYAEMALALAQRMMAEPAEKTPQTSVEHGFRLCTARRPSQRELTILLRVYRAELARMRSDPPTVRQRIQNILPRLRNPRLDPTQLAAWFAVANVLLNLDETISL